MPEQNCSKCEYKHMPNDGGFCYMFLKKPKGKCGQFTPVSTKNHKQMKKFTQKHMPGFAIFVN